MVPQLFVESVKDANPGAVCVNLTKEPCETKEPPTRRLRLWPGVLFYCGALARACRPRSVNEAAGLTSLHIVASLDRCRVSDAVCQSGHPAIDGHRVTLVRTVRLGKPRAAGIELQRQSLVRPAIAERSLVGPHTELSGARSGRPEIPTHRDAPRPCLC